MIRFTLLLSSILFLIFFSTTLSGQAPTLTITKEGNVGIGLQNPITKLDVSDIVRIQGHTWPGTGKGIEIAYIPNRHLGLIQVYDRDQTAWGHLYLGNGNVGIGVENPSSKLEVNGAIKSSFGGYIFPDGSVQTTAASDGGTESVWKQAEVNALLTSSFSDKVSITITPPGSGGYFVLTLSGQCYNLEASNQTRIGIYLTNVAGNGLSYPGYIGYWQDSSSGYTRTVPVHATRIFSNANTSAKTFYVYAGDNFNGGYKIYGMFTVQWFPGSQQ
jgi:hypothetical protein